MKMIVAHYAKGRNKIGQRIHGIPKIILRILLRKGLVQAKQEAKKQSNTYVTAMTFQGLFHFKF
jgi:hypothetical protein